MEKTKKKLSVATIMSRQTRYKPLPCQECGYFHDALRYMSEKDRMACFFTHLFIALVREAGKTRGDNEK